MWSGADASYLAAITAAAREYTWRGTLTDANGTAYSFSAEDIVKGSGQISKKVSSDTSLDIGTVYTSELTIRLYLSINRYVLFGGTIDLYCDVDVNGSTYSVPMGEYIISSCSQEMSCLSIVAYDAMTLLDNVAVEQDPGPGDAYDWILYIVSKAGLTLGLSRADIQAMPNGTEILSFTNCNTALEVMSCRDALASICAILCANAYIGRDGSVYLQDYSMTAIDDLGANERFSSSFSDFTTNYTSVSLAIHDSGTTEYYAELVDSGLNYNLGANPWMQDGGYAHRETLCRNLLGALTLIYYEPYTVTIPIRPELDPMDVLTFSGNQASSDKGALTSVVYKLGGAMTIKCSGENPKLAKAKSKNDKDILGITSAQEQNKFRIFSFTNQDPISIADGASSVVAYFHVVALKDTQFLFNAEIKHTAETTEVETAGTYTNTDLVITVTETLNGDDLPYSPIETEQDGERILHLSNNMSVEEGGVTLAVSLSCSGGSVSIAAGDVTASIAGIGLDALELRGIRISHLPYQYVVYVDDYTDYTGLQVIGTYSDGSESDITAGCVLTPADGAQVTAEGEITVNVTFEE